MSLRSIFDRSRDALYAFATRSPVVERVEEMGIGHDGLGTMAGMGGLIGGNDVRTVLFWAAIAMVLLLLAALSNPNESSFRSHLTELSFRRHLVDIRTSDSLNTSTDHSEIETNPPNALSTSSSSSSSSTPTPFRFANHVSINLRTPPLLYRSHLFFSTGIATPLASPFYLAMSDPLSVLKRGREREKDRSTVFIGFFGHWSPVTINLISELIVAILGDGREKGKRRERPGIVDVKAISSKEDSLPAKPMPLAPKLLKPESAQEPLAPPTPPPSVSRRPSLGQTPADAADSPLVSSLKSELATAQSTLNDLQSQLHISEQSTDSSLTGSLDELRNRRKEDDAERQELKSKTKSLEEQKRQAESGRREAEKKLKAVENLRDGLEAKIQAARDGAVETRGNMETSEKNVRTIQEDGARHVVETLDNVELKKQELGRLELELEDLETKNENLGSQVKEAEDRLKVVTESGARASPEEEMMMMAAAYEAAAQEGYHHQSQNTWANQAAAYMAEAGMPYLGQDYTARSTRHTSANHHADLEGFDDFGPGPGHRDAHHPTSVHPFHPLDIPTRSHLTAGQAGQAGHESEEEVEIDPSSPNGTSFLPQGLFRSIEGDATPLDLDGHDSASDSGDESWRSPVPEHALPQPQVQPLRESSSALSRFRAPSTTPPIANTTINSAITGLPALPGSRRWVSGTQSNENVAFSFLNPGGTTSNDSLNASPFAPSASEKQALKWGPLSRYRWARGTESVPGPSARTSSIDLGNGVVALNSSLGTTSTGSGTASTGNWLSSRFGSSSNRTTTSDNSTSAFNAFNNSTPNSSSNLHRHVSLDLNDRDATGAQVHGLDEEEDGTKAEKRFGFFSLRKTPSSTS